MSCSCISGIPVQLSRRSLMLGTAYGITAAGTAALAAEPVGEPTVTEALRLRRSTRAFSDRAVEPPTLAELLWAAFGINRPSAGLHTAPSWRGAADAMIHVALADGVSVYDPPSGTLRPRHGSDLRAILSPQAFVATAPVCLLYISDLRRLTAEEDHSQRRVHARVNAAMIAQNVYLFAAARGLGTCLVGGFDGPAISAALDLEPHEFITCIQPVGWPAE